MLFIAIYFLILIPLHLTRQTFIDRPYLSYIVPKRHISFFVIHTKIYDADIFDQYGTTGKKNIK